MLRVRMRAWVRERGLALSAVLVVGCQSAPVPPKSTTCGCGGEREVVQSGAARALTAFDADSDGRVDSDDVEYFQRMASRAEREVSTRPGVDGAVEYEARDLGVLFAGLFRGERGCHCELPDDRAREVAVEARWAAAQAKIARLADGDEQRLGDLRARWFPGVGDADLAASKLCRLVENAELDSWSDTGLAKIALFDIDRTLWRGSIIDTYLAVLIEEGVLREEANPRLRRFLKTVPGIDAAAVDAANVTENAKLFQRHTREPSLPDESKINAKDGFFETVALMRGVSLDAARRAAELTVNRGTREMPSMGSQFYRSSSCSVPELIDSLRDAGFEVYLLSATLDVLAQATGEALGIGLEHVVGSPLEKTDGRYTGEVLLSTYNRKGQIARAWLPAPPLLVFGDSARSDVPMMLEAVGVSFMINPDDDMLASDAGLADGRFVEVEFDEVVGDG